MVAVAVLATAFAAGTGTAEAAVSAHGSAEQVYATGLRPEARASLLDRAGKTVAKERASRQGGVLFREVKPGSGYRVRVSKGGGTAGPLRVDSTRSAPRDTDVYNQPIPSDGYGYLTTRDGTKLAYSVHPPLDAVNALGLDLPQLPVSPPYPTLIEYSGYGYARPSGPQSGIATVANLMGFAVVDVNMRGTGCSGGAFDFFEPLQGLDGYDVIETIARQPWVSGNRVGMLGISYGGISQLFTAQTRPPSLAAIAPLSVIDATQTTLYPGGLLNTGFALNWAEERVHDSKPARPGAGQEWALERIRNGDKVCKENQALHGEAANLLAKVRANDHYVPKVADPLAPVTFVDKINVPVFMACQFTDEQTGGHCPTLAERFTGTDKKWFTFTNGTHVDSLDPETLNRMYDFLKLYVARAAPSTGAAVLRATAPVIYGAAFGINGLTLPPDPIQSHLTYEGALEAFEKLDPVRILFDNGAGGSQPGWPYPGFERSFPRFPIPGTRARSWYLAPGGDLADKAPPGKRADAFKWNAGSRPPTNFTGNTGGGSGGLWTATPGYNWKQDREGSAVSYLTDPLDRTTTVVGAGALHVWIRASEPRVDLQATVSEVRPDGKETFVQSGWLRADAAKLDARKSTPLEPVLSLRKADVKPVPRKRFMKVTIPLYYQAHAYRAGSSVRIRVSAPNGEQPIWAFAETEPKGSANVAIGYGKKMDSRLVLPEIPDVKVPTGLPPCPGLRGEPCRTYKPLRNRTTKP